MLRQEAGCPYDRKHRSKQPDADLFEFRLCRYGCRPVRLRVIS